MLGSKSLDNFILFVYSAVIVRMLTVCRFALSDSVARYCPPLPVQVFMNSRDVGW
jgi:hypothetical protein